MADPCPSFLVTCNANVVPRYSDVTVEIDTNGKDPTSETTYSKGALANYAFVMKSCSYKLTDPEAKQTARDLALRLAKMSDAMPDPVAKKKAPAQLRATVESNQGPHIQAHSLEGVLR